MMVSHFFGDLPSMAFLEMPMLSGPISMSTFGVPDDGVSPVPLVGAGLHHGGRSRHSCQPITSTAIGELLFQTLHHEAADAASWPSITADLKHG